MASFRTEDAQEEITVTEDREPGRIKSQEGLVQHETGGEGSQTEDHVDADADAEADGREDVSNKLANEPRL